jgi:c-di-GMP-related signal transduction protein
MRDLLDELPLSDAVAEALTDGRGTLGLTLDLVRACERDDDRLLDSLAPGRAAELRTEFERAQHWVDAQDTVLSR